MYVFRNDTIARSRRHHHRHHRHRHRRRRRRCRRRCCISTDRGSIPYQRALGSLSFSRSWLSFGRAGFDRANKPSVAHQPTVESCSVSPLGLRERVAASLPLASASPRSRFLLLLRHLLPHLLPHSLPEYWTNEREERNQETRGSGDRERDRARTAQTSEKEGNIENGRQRKRVGTSSNANMREKDGGNVKQGTLPAYSIARETCRLCGSPCFLSLALTTLFLASSLSFSTALFANLSPSSPLAFRVSLSLSLLVLTKLAYLHPER